MQFVWILAFFAAIIFHPVKIEAANANAPLYHLFFDLISGNTLLVHLVYALLILLEAFILQLIVVYHRLIERNNFIVVLVWFIYAFSNPATAGINPVLLSVPLVSWGLFLLLDISSKENVLPGLFSVGLIFSLASLIYLPLIWFSIFLILSLIVLSLINMREILVILIAYILPYVYVFAYLFVMDIQPDFLRIAGFGYDVEAIYEMVSQNPLGLVLNVFLLLVSIAGLIKLLPDVLYKLIQTRNFVTVLIIMLIISFLMIFVSGYWWHDHLYLVFIPLAILMAMFLAGRKRLLYYDIALLAIMLVEILQVYWNA